MEAPSRPPFVPALAFTDPTPNAIINQRIAHVGLLTCLNQTDMTEHERNEFVTILLATSRKMVSVWKHLDRYRIEEDRLKEEFSDSGNTHIDYGQTLLDEFDGFCVQIKSTLDYSVKMLKPILGKRWTVHTFGDKGETVFSALERNTGKVNQGRVRFMKKLCFDDNHKAWLKAAIEARNRINKFQEGGVDMKTFAVFRTPSGEIAVPRWSNEQTLRHAMEGIWAQFFFFMENFVMCSLNFRLRDDTALVRVLSPIESAKPSWAAMHHLLAKQFIEQHKPKPI